MRSDGVLVNSYPQPYVVGDLSIFYRGYVANVAELSRGEDEGATDPTRFAQCFANAFERWGCNLSGHVFGEYAVVIHKGSTRELVLAHDSLGIVPLYYHETDGGISFASHIKDLVQPASHQKLDEEYIADYLRYGDHYGKRTPYAEIKRLTAGSSISYSDGKLTSHECWGISFEKRIRYSDMRDYEEHLRCLVKEAVETALPETGKTWCELSGGLDSSTVLALALRSPHAQDVQSLSFVYPKSGTADESEWIDAVIEKYGVVSHRLNADAVRPFTQLPIDVCSQPYHAIMNVARYRLYEQTLADHDVDVVLTGMGGDAVFLGDGPEPFFMADLLLGGHFITLRQKLRLWCAESKPSRPSTYWLQRCALIPAFRRFRKQVIQDQPPKIPWLAKDYLSRLGLKEETRRTWSPGNVGAAEQWYLERVIRCSNIVSHWDYTASMRAEFRHPLMYLPLVQFIYSIPWEVKLSPHSDRVLQRAAFASILPEAITTRKTKARLDHAIYSGLEAGADWVRLLTDKPFISQRGYVDQHRWNEAVELATMGRCNSLKHFVAAATLEIWLRQLDVGNHEPVH